MDQEAAVQAWDHHAATYARLATPFTGYIGHALFQSVAGRLPAAPRILEVGCGHGDIARAAVLHGLAQPKGLGRVVATDFSSAMVRLAARNLETLGAHEGVLCEVQDGQALGYPDGSFDAVFSAFGIFLFPDRHAGWREARRVLASAGILATAVWRGPEHNDLARLQMGPLLAALPERVRSQIPRAGWLDIATQEGLASELSEMGFVDIEISVFDAVLTMPTPAAMWHMMEDNPMTKTVLAECSPAEREAVGERIMEAFEEMAGAPDRPLRLPASCHFAVARRP